MLIFLQDKVYGFLRTPTEVLRCPIEDCGKEEADREAWERHIREVHHTMLNGMPSGSKHSVKSETLSEQEPKTHRARFRPAKQVKASSGSQMEQRFYIEIPDPPPYSKPASMRGCALRTRPTPLRGRPAKRPKVYHQSKHWESERLVTITISDTKFRLHTSRLERSAWFKNRLSNHDLKLIDVDETKVSSHDFEILLDSLDKFSTFEEEPPTFIEITAILRAATALRFEAEAEWAANRIRMLWSSQFVDVNLMHRSYAVETITSARQCNLKAVIKPAFYELVRSATTPDMMKDDIQNGRLTMEDLVMIESARQKLSVRWVALVSVHGNLERFPHCGDDTKVLREQDTRRGYNTSSF
ncbi:hypothetical protein C0993_000391 [Termitomyces sp. T159_Od127]|nr:hypothetical protein C0993_000391 [Termitomyces sp. T159_Od127]